MSRARSAAHLEQPGRALALRMGTTLEHLRSSSRTKSLVRLRKLFAYVMRAQHRASYPELGCLLDRDHTSVIQEVQSVLAEFTAEELRAWCEPEAKEGR